MYRSYWELATHAHYQIAQLANELRAHSVIEPHRRGPATLLTRLRRGLGISLIRIGHRLAGDDRYGGFAMLARPATWGRPSF